MKVFSLLLGFLWGGMTLDMAYAGQSSTRLDVQITLEPACYINQGLLVDGERGVSLGVLDFGQVRPNFKIVETGLNHKNGSGLVIECPSGVNAQVVFGAGLHDAYVPSPYRGTYYHALSNSERYVAYNLYTDASKQKVIVPHVPINIPAGKAFRLFPHAKAVGQGGLTQGLYTDTLAVTISF